MTTTSPARSPRPPVIGTTRYDLVTSALMAGVAGLALAVAILLAWWLSIRPTAPEAMMPVEMVELSGGSPDGEENSTPDLETDAAPTDDPSLAEIVAENNEVVEQIENIVEMADQASEQAARQFEPDLVSAGKPGSATGTGRRALGMGPGNGGFPREQRWFIRFGEDGSLDEYAEQLDFFGIELGLLRPTGDLLYLSQLSAARPTVRTASSGKGEKRLYFTWQGGGRKAGDIRLFKKAGIDVGGGLLFHFYPKPTETLLATAERVYRNRPVAQIRRTYFVVRPGRKEKFEFAVSMQTYY